MLREFSAASEGILAEFVQYVRVKGLFLRIGRDASVKVIEATGMNIVIVDGLGRVTRVAQKTAISLPDGGAVIFSEGEETLPDCFVMVGDMIFSADNPAKIGSEITIVRPDPYGWPPIVIPLGPATDVR